MGHNVFRGILCIHLQPDRCFFDIVAVAVEHGANAAFHDRFRARDRDEEKVDKEDLRSGQHFMGSDLPP